MKAHARFVVMALTVLSSNSYAQWELADCGITGDVRFLTMNSSAVFAATLDGVFRSTDHGEQWSLVSAPLPVDGGRQLQQFVASETHLFFCRQHAFVSQIGGGSWWYSEEGLTGGSIPELTKHVQSVALSGTDVLIGTGGGFFVSTDIGDTWSRSGLVDYDIWGLAACGPIVYASSKGGSVYYSSDGGELWAVISEGLPGMPPYGMLGFALCGEYVFTYTSEHALYLSTDPATPWIPANDGLPLRSSYSATGNPLAYFAGAGSGVFRSFDGLHWEPAGEGLPAGAGIGGGGNQGLIMSGEYLFAIVKDGTGQKVWRRAVADALPIQLVAFTASAVPGGRVGLFWKTASEINNFGFEIQKAASPPAYQSIPGAFLAGHGTTLEPQEYSWTDPAGEVGEYYRLKQIDLGGTVHYSGGVIAMTVTGTGHQGVVPTGYALCQNYPNPFNPCTSIRYALPVRGYATLIVFDALGQSVATLVDGIQEAGEHEVRLDGSGLASGVYFYRLQAGESLQTKMLVLLR